MFFVRPLCTLCSAFGYLRERKDAPRGLRDHRGMARRTISLTTTVAEVLSEFPAAASAFVARRLDCVGCDMAAFETIGDVAANYRLNARDLLVEIRAASSQKPNTKRTK